MKRASSSSSLEKPNCRKFTLSDIKSATKNFSDENLISDEGGFGTVYKGTIDNEKTPVAVKKLKNTNEITGFDEEIAALSQIQHCNIVSLIGYCSEGLEKILVYEFVENGTLKDHLHKRLRDNHSELEWNTRLKILIGVARGLYHLHYCIRGGSFIHRDVKSANILLDKNYEAKVGDFGLARHVALDDPRSHFTTGYAGTLGYIDPYNIQCRKLTKASDTYSFGVIILEVLSGRKAFVESREEPMLSYWALEKKPYEILDPSLHESSSEESLWILCNVAKRCLGYIPKGRPDMGEVLAMLELALLKSNNDSGNTDVSPISHLDIPLYMLEREFNEFAHHIEEGYRKSTVYWSSFRHPEMVVVIKKNKFCQVPEQVFLAQVLTMSSLDHENVLKLEGYCMTNDKDYYVYEYASLGSLHAILHKHAHKEEEIIKSLPWSKRIKIAVDVASGLSYIHDVKDLYHRNIKSSNVLIFEDGTAKIGDLHIFNPCSCNFPAPIRGGRPPCKLYHPPEFSKDGDSKASDVYSFGVVLLELLTGKQPIDPTLPEGMSLVSWAKPHLRSEGSIQTVVELGEDYPLVPVKKMAKVVELCLENEPRDRPTMGDVLNHLKSAFYETQIYYQKQKDPEGPILDRQNQLRDRDRHL